MKKQEIISSGPTKYNTFRAPRSVPHIWKSELGVLDRYSTEFFENWMDSKIIESYEFPKNTRH